VSDSLHSHSIPFLGEEYALVEHPRIVHICRHDSTSGARHDSSVEGAFRPQFNLFDSVLLQEALSYTLFIPPQGTRGLSKDISPLTQVRAHRGGYSLELQNLCGDDPEKTCRGGRISVCDIINRIYLALTNFRKRGNSCPFGHHSVTSRVSCSCLF
jgi:hypothetical protein